MDKKYEGKSFTLVKVKLSEGKYSHVIVVGGHRALIHRSDGLNVDGFWTCRYSGINQDAILVIDNACRRANRGERVDFTKLLD